MGYYLVGKEVGLLSLLSGTLAEVMVCYSIVDARRIQSTNNGDDSGLAGRARVQWSDL